MQYITLTNLLHHQKEAYEKGKQYSVFAFFMDMGTGKTRTTIEIIKDRLNNNKIDCVLWFCPLSCKKNLKKDLIKHCNFEEKIYICALETLSQSDLTYLKIYNYVEKHKERIMIVVDESHMIKNHDSNRAKRLHQFSKIVKYKIILTGTPSTNGIQDLWSQFYFLHPKILGYNSFFSFSNKHLEYSDKFKNMVVRSLNVDLIYSKIEPYIYQIKKSECFDLLHKTYNSYYCDLTKQQIYYYDWLKNKILEEISKSTDSDYGYKIFELFSGLRNIISGFYKKHSFACERINILNNIIETIDLTNNKLIIFYNFNHDLKEIVKNLKNHRFSVLHGALKTKEKEKNLFDFEKENNILVCNVKMGCYGLNLQHANYIIYYNNNFGYSTRIQSEDRIYRFGQQKNCYILDIITISKLDERIKDALNNKESIKEQLEEALKNKSKQDIIDMLKEMC